MTGARRCILTAFVAMLLSVVSSKARAQQISIDQGVQAAGLWCFPLVSEPKTYVYLPSTARLAASRSP